MKMIDWLTEQPLVQSFNKSLKPQANFLVNGLDFITQATLIAASFALSKSKNYIVVVDSITNIDMMVENLSSFVDDDIFQFPVEENLARQISIASIDLELLRVQALNALLNEKPAIIVTNTSGLLRYLPTSKQFSESVINLAVEDVIKISDLSNKLFNSGYQRNQLVEMPGEFAVRGEIVDIFPLDQQQPLRIDFFDETIESIKIFDNLTQQSVTKIDQVDVIPATDLIINGRWDDITESITKQFNQFRSELKGNDKKIITENFQPLLDDLNHKKIDSKMRLFSGIIFPEKTTLLDYLNEDGVVFYSQIKSIEQNYHDNLIENNQALDEMVEKLELLNQIDMQSEFQFILTKPQTRIDLNQFMQAQDGTNYAENFNFTTRRQTKFFNQIDALIETIKNYNDNHWQVFLTVNNDSENQLNQLVLDNHLNVQIVEGAIDHGFEWNQLKVAVISQSDIFENTKKKSRKKHTIENAERLRSYSDLKIGDYVVHVNHGIGKFEGIEKIESNGGIQDYLSIAFAKNSKIFVPVTQIDLVQKFVSSNDGKPKLDALGGSDWAKRKRATQQKIEDIADELIELYSKRQQLVGFEFPKDTHQQEAFDSDFDYVETDDQLRSIDEIKDDMEKSKPMDRLLVGDVGFGKTEVAMRAAFKAIQSDKQVAILAPTTILVQQHYQTAINRFKNFPEIKIEMISRFNSTSHNKKILEDLKNHQINFVIGTHALLNKNINFADLGLLIVDEEQRFGVKHKERLKQLRSNVDVLTLTATPIPRTLNMAMVGARDLSLLETPPENRYPIQTYVIEHNWSVVADAIKKEIARNGQVFYLHNRVSDIEKTAGELSKIIPDAQVGIIHGQMDKVELENQLIKFLNGEYDVLVTTTIIETGIDMPNANTLIVENAQNFGLAQLYQIRGRIGRSNRISFAYLTFPSDRQPNEVAQKRLETLRDFTELGSGFKLAMRDLSIRGAGDLLGKQQSGFIDSVGYDLYQDMLKNAVDVKLNRVDLRTKTDSELILGITGLLPDSYITDSVQKIEMYKSIRRIETAKQAVEIREMLADRFGKIPTETENLILIARVKNLADKINILNIKRDGEILLIKFNQLASENLAGNLIFETLLKIDYQAKVRATDNLMIVSFTIDDDLDNPQIWLNKLINYLIYLLEILK